MDTYVVDGYAHVTAVIGRNVGINGTQLDSDTWQEFQDTLDSIVRGLARLTTGVDMLSQHRLNNVAVGAGNSEQSGGISMTIKHTDSDALQEFETELAKLLSTLASNYQQVCIAYSVTPSKLAWAS